MAFPSPVTALEQKLLAADGAADDHLGSSVAIEKDTVVVGAPNANGGRGAAYIFRRAGDSWIQTTRLSADGAVRFGASVAIDKDAVVVGAPHQNAGAVYVFIPAGDGWSQAAKLTASDGAVGDQLGTSVAIDSDTIVAGAIGYDNGASPNQGAVYTFARNGAAERGQTAKLTASDGAENDVLGWSVAIDGDTIVAGAPFDEPEPSTNGLWGSAYTFASTGAPTRTQTAKLITSDNAPFAELGFSVAIDGDTVVAGAIGADGVKGSAYTFATTGPAVRPQTAKLTAGDGAPDDFLGLSVAIHGDTIVAGAPRDDIGLNVDQGSAYTFARTGGAVRTQTGRLTAADGAADDEVGLSVAIDGDTIVAGAHLDDVGGRADQGSASIFFSPASELPASSPPGPVAGREGGPSSGACANPKRGTRGSDTLRGTRAGDRLFGLGGSDLLSGLLGDDCLIGGPGADRLLGGAGNDRLQGGRGGDVAAGGPGSDTLAGGTGNDRLSGGAGNDRLSGGAGRNRYVAGGGRDTVNARNRRREQVRCGPGRDRAIVDRADRVHRCDRVRRR